MAPCQKSQRHCGLGCRGGLPQARGAIYKTITFPTNQWDLAETGLKELEAKKASLPTALQDLVGNARKMLDAAKAGLGAAPAPK